MVHDVRAARRARECGAVLEIPTNNVDPGGLEILICAFMPLRRFGEFREATGIAANILADRLQRLRDAEVLTQADSGYRLTDRGVDLYGALVAVQSWADDWITRRYRSPVLLIHRACGERLRR